MIRSLFATSAVVALCVAGAAAQTGSPGTGNPAGKSPTTPRAAPAAPTAHMPNDADRLFVRQATLGGNAEVELGKLAAQKGHSDAVKKFGETMVQDHGKANDQLTALAKAANIPQPQGVDAAHKDTHDRLLKSSGNAFDRAYIAAQVSDHQQTAQLLQHEISAGQDEALKHFATETLPVVMHHLQMAQGIQGQLRRDRPMASGAPQSQANPGRAERSTSSAAERKRTEELNLQQLQKQ